MKKIPISEVKAMRMRQTEMILTTMNAIMEHKLWPVRGDVNQIPTLSWTWQLVSNTSLNFGTSG